MRGEISTLFKYYGTLLFSVVRIGQIPQIGVDNISKL